MRIAGAVWSDFLGRSRLTIVRASTNPCGILTATQAVSNASILYNWDGPLDPGIGVATSAVYEGVQQWVGLLFQTAAGTTIRLTLPAPQLGILQADKQSVNPSSIAALIAACLGELADPSGNVATTYLGGILQPDRSDLNPIGT